LDEREPVAGGDEFGFVLVLAVDDAAERERPFGVEGLVRLARRLRVGEAGRDDEDER
jgi:hypothetical protein